MNNTDRLLEAPIITSLLDTDKYKFSMQQVNLHQYPKANAQYAFKCRNKDIDLTPIVDAVRAHVDQTAKLKFEADELEFLSHEPHLTADYIDYLADFRLDANHVIVEQKEGGLVIHAKGPMLKTSPWELYVLPIVNELWFRHTVPEPDYEKGQQRLSDDVLVERWSETPYYQAFTGATEFQWALPCDPSDLTYFRKRIGSDGHEKILAMSIMLHAGNTEEDEMCIDSTVQEKNITYPTDAKQYRKIHAQLLKIARQEQIPLTRTYEKEEKRLKRHTQFSGSSKQRKQSRNAVKRLKTISGRLLREIQRKMSAEALENHSKQFSLYQRMLDQKRGDKNKLYSLHEPHVYCMSKGKPEKRYEFGTKASITTTRDSGIVIGALAFDHNVFDGHTTPAVLEQIKRLLNRVPGVGIGDRGYRGKSKYGETVIVTPKPARKNASDQAMALARTRFRRRAGIEPIIGHLKSDHRLKRNFLKGFSGDQINVLMAAAAFNFKKWMREAIFWLYFMRSPNLFFLQTRT